MVRIGALDMLEAVPAAQIWPLASPLLSDSEPRRAHQGRRRCSRRSRPPASRRPIASGSSAPRPSSSPPSGSTPTGRKSRSRSATSTPGAAAPREAEAEYKAALRLSPQYAPAAVNLADLYRQPRRGMRGRRRAARGDRRLAAGCGAAHSLGLALTRLKRPDEALAELRRAAELAPEQARYAYVYAVALHSSGRGGEAMRC